MSLQAPINKGFKTWFKIILLYKKYEKISTLSFVAESWHMGILKTQIQQN